MSINIINGQSVYVKAVFTNSQGGICQPVANVTWSSSNTNIANVLASNNATSRIHPYFYETAIITAVSSGTTTITASSTDINGNPLTNTIGVTSYANTPVGLSINQIL